MGKPDRAQGGTSWHPAQLGDAFRAENPVLASWYRRVARRARHPLSKLDVRAESEAALVQFSHFTDGDRGSVGPKRGRPHPKEWISILPWCVLKSLQSCPTLCNPVGCSPPGSSVHGIHQARILERVAMPSSRGSSPPRDRTWSPAWQADSLPLSHRGFAFLLSLFGTSVPCVSPGSPWRGAGGGGRWPEGEKPPNPVLAGKGRSLRPPLAAPEPASPQLSRRGRHCRIAVPEEGGGERWRVPAPLCPPWDREFTLHSQHAALCEDGGGLPFPSPSLRTLGGFQSPLRPLTRGLYHPDQPTQEACDSGTV